eukprot:541899-Amphidinium_carterae.1
MSKTLLHGLVHFGVETVDQALLSFRDQFSDSKAAFERADADRSGDIDLEDRMHSDTNRESG